MMNAHGEHIVISVIRLDINDHIEHLSGDALDAAIDAARGEEKRE